MEFFSDARYKSVAAALFALLLCVAALLYLRGELPDGCGKEYYLYKSSSACEITDEIKICTPRKVVRGEAVTLKTERDVKKTLNGLFAAKVFSESGEDFSSDYYFSFRIRRYAIINGRKVNLHVCKTADGYELGSPIIFGGY